MSSPKIIALLLLCLLKLTHPVWSSSASSSVADNSDTLNSDEIVPPSLSSSPLLVQSPHFIPTSSLFLPAAPENAVTSDGIGLLLTEDDVDQVNGGVDSLPNLAAEETSGDTVRPPPASEFMEAVNEEEQEVEPESTSWNVLEGANNDESEIDTESSPTLTPEDVIQTQAIPIESYVVTERRAKSELLPPNRVIKDAFLPDTSLDLTVKNLTSDPEDLENALFNDTTGTMTSSSVEEEGEQLDQVSSGSMEHGIAAAAPPPPPTIEGSDESVVTDSEFATKQIVTEKSITTTTTTTTTTHAPVVSNNHNIHNINRKKQPKYIKKFRASASEVLRFFMEGSYLRSPLAVLVDTSDKTLEKTKILWNATLHQTTANIDMVLVTFDHSGRGFFFFNLLMMISN